MNKIKNIFKTLISSILVCIPFVVFTIGMSGIMYYSVNENLHTVLFVIGITFGGLIILSFGLIKKHIDVVLESVFNVKNIKN